jgi:tetratricopeptide (TPR) repeat protein
LAFTENKKFKYASSDNVLAQLAYDDGMEYINSGDLENAISKFKKAVEIDPKFAFAWDNLGISYRKNQEYDKAIAAYMKSLEIYPEGRLPLLNIAIAYNLNKQYEDAIVYYNKFIEIYSEDPEGYYGLGLILYTQDQEEAGLDNLIRAYTIYTAQDSPYRADAAKKIGYMYKDLKNQDKLEVFHKVADKYNLKVQNN